ncbi:MAG: aminotransferase class IV [Planctomycetota bacterium]|nr:aminotransferase class IV [Planctomycetota bacterium]
MSQPEFYLNGKFVLPTEASIPISDVGFIHGATITEQLRTFGGHPFLLDQHIARLQTGLQTLEIDLSQLKPDFESLTREVCQRYLDSKGVKECGIGIFCTPGTTSRFGGLQQDHPTVCIYAYPLPIEEFAKHYRAGVDLVIAGNRDVSKSAWPKSIKARSRLHYYLADLEARKSNGIPLLTSDAGFLRDTSTATPFYLFEKNEITLSPADEILDSVSMNFLIELANACSISVVRREIHRSEIDQLRATALVSSLFSLYTCRSIDGRKLETGHPEIQQLKTAWTRKAGYDFFVSNQ